MADRTSGLNNIDIGSGRRGFRDRNLALGQAGTIVDAAWANGLQEEILYIIEQGGLVPDAKNWTQVLQALRSMFSRQMQVFVAPGTFLVPDGVTRLKVRLWGSGGGGGGSNGAGSAGVAGAGGGYSEGAFAVTPGASIPVTVGTAGAGGVGGGAPQNGSAGGTSSFGAFATATGGQGGVAANGTIGSSVNSGGVGSGGQVNRIGTPGGFGYPVGSPNFHAGSGGTAFCGSSFPVVASVAATGASAFFPGCGGGGGLLGGGGGNGAAGLVIVEW